MKVTQISVFLSNSPGALARMTSHLARFDINIRAVALAESMDSGVVRLIVSDPARASAALQEEGYGFVTTEVVTAEIPDRPGALSDLCCRLAEADIDVRYLYATVTPGGGVAMAVLSTNDNDRAEQMLSS